MSHNLDPRAPGRQRSLVALLERVAQHDAAAFRDLYTLSAPALLGVALRITRNRASAEDALQDSYLKIWRFASAYRAERAAAMTWMAAIVRHQALDLLRRAALTEPLPDDFGAAAGVSGDGLDGAEPEASLHRSLDAARLEASLRQLHPMQRQAIALAYFRDQSHAEIADTLAVPAGTVKSWIRRGQQFLKASLEGSRDGTPAPRQPTLPATARPRRVAYPA